MYWTKAQEKEFNDTNQYLRESNRMKAQEIKRLKGILNLFDYHGGHNCICCQRELDTFETDHITRSKLELVDWVMCEGKYYCSDCYYKMEEQNKTEC
jgi:hypothetical protein